MTKVKTNMTNESRSDNLVVNSRDPDPSHLAPRTKPLMETFNNIKLVPLIILIVSVSVKL